MPSKGRLPVWVEQWPRAVPAGSTEGVLVLGWFPGWVRVLVLGWFLG